MDHLSLQFAGDREQEGVLDYSRWGAAPVVTPSSYTHSSVVTYHACFAGGVLGRRVEGFRDEHAENQGL